MPTKVKISIYSILREKLGWKEKEIIIDDDNPTFIDVLKSEPELYKLVVDNGGSIKEGYIVLINGIHIEFKGGPKTTIRNGDEISIFPPGGGG